MTGVVVSIYLLSLGQFVCAGCHENYEESGCHSPR